MTQSRQVKNMRVAIAILLGLSMLGIVISISLFNQQRTTMYGVREQVEHYKQQARIFDSMYAALQSDLDSLRKRTVMQDSVVADKIDSLNLIQHKYEKVLTNYRSLPDSGRIGVFKRWLPETD
ncbi:MAG: hypothetical protein H6550_16085 [Chitinophagales bacterium]|nr:hypothetical protein [Chitinophagales bacterium]